MNQGVSWGGVLGIVTLVILGMTAAGFVYWKRTQEQMREQVCAWGGDVYTYIRTYRGGEKGRETRHTDPLTLSHTYTHICDIQVRSILAEYMPLEDAGDVAGGSAGNSSSNMDGGFGHSRAAPRYYDLQPVAGKSGGSLHSEASTASSVSTQHGANTAHV